MTSAIIFALCVLAICFIAAMEAWENKDNNGGDDNG